MLSDLIGCADAQSGYQGVRRVASVLQFRHTRNRLGICTSPCTLAGIHESFEMSQHVAQSYLALSCEREAASGRLRIGKCR